MATRALHFDGSYAHYAQAGQEGPAIVLLHGWAASLKQWEWLLPSLADAGYAAYAIDLLGHGGAPQLCQDHGIEEYLEYLRQWLKALDIRHPALLGHSMGGYLSIRYALDHPGCLRGLVLVDPLFSHHQFDRYHQFGRWLLSKPEMFRAGEVIFRHIPTWVIEASHYLNPYDLGRVSATLRRQVALDHKRADPRIVQTIADLDDLRPRLHQVMAPTLVTWGSRDHLLCPDSFENLIDLLPAAQGHRFTDAGHHPHLTHPQDFTELVLAFLRQIEDEKWVPTEASQTWTGSITSFPAGH